MRLCLRSRLSCVIAATAALSFSLVLLTGCEPTTTPDGATPAPGDCAPGQCGPGGCGVAPSPLAPSSPWQASPPANPSAPLANPPATVPYALTLPSLVSELETRLATVSQISDYTATLTKHERINNSLNGAIGTLGDYEQATLKIRHRPFSAYLKFTYPPDLAGREVLYVEGQNGGKMVVRRGGRVLDNVTLNVDPNGPAAMDRNRYPITHLGIQNMLGELLRIGKAELNYPAEELEIRQTVAAIDGRQCRVLMFRHTVERPEYTFFMANLYIDEALNLPVRHEAYGWPVRGAGNGQSQGAGNAAPVLIEEYTYTGVRINVGLTDADFDVRNPEYGFRLGLR